MINEEEAKNMEKNDENEETIEERDKKEDEEKTPEEMEIIREIEAIKEEVEKKLDKADLEEMKGWKADILARISSIQKELETLKKEDERILANFREFTDIITKKNEDMMKIVEQKVDAEKLRQFRKDMAKMEKKLNLVMEETGFGEILDVAKIPPNILEIVYDSTLKDVTNAIWQEYGPGAEKIITDVLEDIRLETSGSEMFYFDGRRIRTRDVAKNIKRGMISARQLQDTYEELLRKLLERVPGHKSKNFRAMIKLKSQEYTVDKTTFLLERVEKMENTVMMLNGMVSGLANNLNREVERLRNELAEISERVESQMKEWNESMEKNMEELRKYNEEMMRKIRKEMMEKMEAREKEIILKIEELKAPSPREEEKSAEKISVVDLTEEERFVYSAIPPEGITYAKLRKITDGMIGTPLEEVIEKLKRTSLIYEKKRGKSVRYFLQPEDEENKNKDKKNREQGKKKKPPKRKKEGPKREKKVDERWILVINSIPENGCTLNRLRKSIGDGMSYEELLDTVKELVDKEYLVVTTRGRHTIYKKNEEKIKEIGGEKDA